MPNPNGVVQGNAQNIPEAHVPRTRSRFPLHYEYPHSDPFGEYRPHYCEDVNKDEVLPIHSSHEIRSYTLKSPLMQNVRRNKDYFFVPSEAILPLNWEKFFDHPVRGDDVTDDVGPTVSGFWRKVAAFMGAQTTNLNTILAGTPTDAVALQSVLRYLILGEYFYSNGNLLATLDCHGAPYVSITPGSSHDRKNNFSWDALFDDFINVIRPTVDNFNLSVDGYSYYVSDRQVFPGLDSISWHHALSLMRDNPTFTIGSVTLVASGNIMQNAINTYLGKIQSISFLQAEVNCKLERLWAYQLVCAHFFTNDHIDFVYSAELYRQLIGNYITRISSASNIPSQLFFARNGIRYQYDYLSAKAFDWIITHSYATNDAVLNGTTSQCMAVLGYVSALFAFRRSLRYLDYFTGSRSQPLAVVGNTGATSTDVAVSGGKVSVIDITKSIQAQRLLNSVNRVKHSFEGYLKGIFGGKLPAPDYHNPFYLAHTSDVIYGQETENTASEQMQDSIAITTNLRGTSGNYVFEARSDRPGIVIGISSYDITRIYSKSMDRTFFHTNRYDWFNPFLQYIGDQEVYIQELGISPGSSTLASMLPFAYTLRHMEYKQKHNYCSGAFCEEGYLPGWIFLAMDRRGNQDHINPDWIRSVPAEFDRFYISLNGYSLATYFHFIVKDFNSTNASRPMAYSPQILG